MPRLIKPHAICRGARIGIAAPAGPVDREALERGESLLRAAGFEPVRRDDLLARDGYLAGGDSRRAAELMQFVRDPSVEAILCARGGYGCDRILGALDADAVRAARKPLIGYSDITALLLWQRRCAGLVGFHGPMLEHGADLDAGALSALLAELTGTATRPLVLSGSAGGGGCTEGRLVGGNLAMVTASLGTPWEIDTRRAILLIEEVGEQPYRIDRMLQQLRAAGKLAELAGIGVGDVSTCVDPRYPTPLAEDVIRGVLQPLSVPLVTGLSIGHVKNNRTWPLGVRAAIDADRGEIRILERGVHGRS